MTADPTGMIYVVFALKTKLLVKRSRVANIWIYARIRDGTIAFSHDNDFASWNVMDPECLANNSF